MAVGNGDGRVRLVDAATGMVRWEVQSYPRSEQKDGHSVAMSVDGRFVVSVSASEESWKLIDVESQEVCMTGARHDGTGACTCKICKRSGVEKGMRMKLDAGCPVQAHSKGLRAVALSPCTAPQPLRLASGGDDFAVILWDAREGTAEHVMHGHTASVVSLSFSVNPQNPQLSTPNPKLSTLSPKS
jgi:WD40 repeat protein